MPNSYLWGILFVIFMSVVDFFMAIKNMQQKRMRQGVLLMVLSLLFMIGAIILIVIQ